MRTTPISRDGSRNLTAALFVDTMPTMGSPTVTIERYAEIRAEMETGRLRDDVLKRAGITIDEWTLVQREWLGRMGDELGRGRFELTNRYTEVFLERQQALKASENHESVPFVEAFVLPPQPPHAATRPAHSLLDATLDISDAVRAVMTPNEALPFDSTGKSVFVTPTVVQQRAISKKQVLESGTLDIEQPQGFASLKDATLPWAGPSAAQHLDETRDFGELLASGVVLPFDPSAPSASKAIEPTEKPVIARPQVSAQLDVTRDISAILQGGSTTKRVTPFERSKPDKPILDATQVDRTMPLPETIATPERLALPLERYASLCVEYAAAPARASEIAARYGLTREQWAKVDAYWRGRMANEPNVRAAWEKACVTYREWLSRQ